ncbi:MAG: hypothetical protein ACSHYA_07880 [Opitutaceae bacterium]
MKPRRLYSIALCIISLFVASCSDSGSPAETAAPAVEPVGPVKKTLGVLELQGIPLDSATGYEVIVVSELEPEGRARIQRQRELFEQKLSGAPAVESNEDALDISPADYTRLNAKLLELKKSFPEVLRMDVDAGEGRLRGFSSDSRMHDEYAYLFKSITLENLERGLNFINEKYEADGEALVEKVEKLEDDAYKREKITLMWLRKVAEHLTAHLELGKELGAAMATVESGVFSEPQDWSGYVAYFRNALIMDVSLNGVGSAMLESPGAFEVEGHGELIVRVEFGADSAFFIISPDEKRVLVKDLQQVVAE